MICPHCGYEHGWSNETMSVVEGEEGGFFCHPRFLERDNKFQYATEYRNLIGCPACLKTFMGD